MFSSLAFVLAVSSPARRCRALLEMLPRAQVAVPSSLPSTDPRLRELNFGAWEGQPWADIDPDAMRVWKTDFVHRAPPKGESLASLHTRALAWLAEARSSHSQRTIACITHLGVVRCLLAHAMRLPLAESMRLQVDFLSIYVIDCAADGTFEFPYGAPMAALAPNAGVG